MCKKSQHQCAQRVLPSIEESFDLACTSLQVVATGTALLARLQLYAVTAQAADVAEQLVKAHLSHTSQMGMQQVSKLINSLSTHLVDLSEELLKSDSSAPPAGTAAALAQKKGKPLFCKYHWAVRSKPCSSECRD